MAKADYRHIDKDPEIDMLRTEAQHRNTNLSPEFLQRLADESGISVYTIKNWFFGDTKRPHNLTLRFVWEALGCERQIVRPDGSVIKKGYNG